MSELAEDDFEILPPEAWQTVKRQTVKRSIEIEQLEKRLDAWGSQASLRIAQVEIAQREYLAAEVRLRLELAELSRRIARLEGKGQN